MASIAMTHRIIILVLGAIVLAGCGGSDSPATSVEKDGVYEAGSDIRPGVWTSSIADSLDCIGFVGTSRDITLDDARGDTERFVSGGLTDGDDVRVAVDEGQFLFVRSCSSWSLDDRAVDRSAVDDACEQLVGRDDLVGRALELATSSDADPATVGQVQKALFAIVQSGTVADVEMTRLAEGAGRLVDLLARPENLVVDGVVSPQVTAAAETIRTTCAAS